MNKKLLLLLCLMMASRTLLAFERIVSINLCTDQILYLLEEPKHIASVSFLAHDKNYSYQSNELSQFPANNAQIEEIIQYHPDLILAGSYSSASTIHFLRLLGYRVEEVDIPQDINHIEEGIRYVGALLNKTEKANAVIKKMQEQKNNALQKASQFTTKPLAVVLAPGGFTHGKNTINGEVLSLAGYRNFAAEVGMLGHGNISLEQLISLQPDYIIIEDATPNQNSLAQRLLQHNAITQGLKKAKPIFIHPNLWTCGGPSIIIALEKLVESHP